MQNPNPVYRYVSRVDRKPTITLLAIGIHPTVYCTQHNLTTLRW